MQEILAKIHSNQENYVLLNIDFKKAFDSIDRAVMWKILRNYGIPEKIVNAIKMLYEGSSSMVRVNGKLSKEFVVTTGVLQGNTLAPFLLLIVLDYILSKTASDQGITTHIEEHIVLPDLDFADDIVLLDENENNAIDHFTHITNVAKNVGLHDNYTKTKVMLKNIENQFLRKLNYQMATTWI